MFTVTADFALGTLPPVSIWPVAALPSSAPKPAQNIVIELPPAAPLPVPFAVKSVFRTEACPFPEPSAVNTPGAVVATSIVTEFDRDPLILDHQSRRSCRSFRKRLR